MITRNGNFRIEENNAYGYDFFSNSPDLKILAKNEYGHGFYCGTILAVEYFGKVYVFSAELSTVVDEGGESILVGGRDYGTCWRALRLEGSARKFEHQMPHDGNPLYRSKEIKDDLEYDRLANLAIEFFSDFKKGVTLPPVRQIKFHEAERFLPKLVEVSVNA